ncbi:MAG: SRPBCC family protein [Saprospiraceae bacterium]|nr:SRPBCC family protein [Saprospiraceae bacterium]
MHYLRRELVIPVDLEQAWKFFSSPANLNALTPKALHFKILSECPPEMYEGLIIRYQITPMVRFPVEWITEITHMKEKSYFVDEQIKGPYAYWHHEHHFKKLESGVLMTDILYYDIGKSILGWMAGKLFVHQKVRDIFNYREHKIHELFPSSL